ncbi:MAG TPA: TolC family protein [Puia sp.]|nr:TolC family protein [Puia sp.]
MNKVFCIICFCSCFFSLSFAQPPGPRLTLQQAVQAGLQNYGTIKAKGNYVNAAKASVKELRREYLPDLSISGQQDYGTVNGQNGPLYGYRGLGVASAGPALQYQSWNAAFGALYLANVNWDFFAFGRAKEKVKLGESLQAENETDLEQEKFQQQIRVAGAYLNLLAAQRLRKSQEDNLSRADSLRYVVVARAKNGLNPGVDSSLANAEVSNARIALTDAINLEQQQNNTLAELMGVVEPPVEYELDTFFVSRIPVTFYDTAQLREHPLLKYYQSRIAVSDQQARYYKTFGLPVFSLFSVFQGRGSGFEYSYGALNPDGYNKGYGVGVNPTRSNYVVGLGVTWNLTNPLRVQQQVAAYRFNSRGLQDEYDLVNLQLTNQLKLSDNKIRNAMANYREAPVQVKAARDAYTQKTVMYQHGLSNIVDVTQALFTLNRAETDRDIAYNNVWQALLLKAAALGDFGIFTGGF